MQRIETVPRLAAFLLVVVTSLLACTENPGSDAPQATAQPDVTDGAPGRTFRMGLSSLPAQLTEHAYAEAFERAGSAGEVVLIQRIVPWEEMLDGDLSDSTIESTAREIELARMHGLDIVFAIDAVEVVDGRSQLAGLPDDLRGAGFGDAEVQEAFVAYAQYVAENYGPRYLALGAEINSYQQQHPEDFERFVILYHEAYDAVKALSPETLVFPTFQYEELQGLLPVEDPVGPQWHLISRFEPNLDVLAVSSYPSLVFQDNALVPESYFLQLSARTDHPVALAGAGYSSELGVDAQHGEEEQTEFLRRLLDNAQAQGMEFVVWFVGQDPTFEGGEAFEPFRHTGLLRGDGSIKDAWTAWTAAARRPLLEK